MITNKKRFYDKYNKDYYQERIKYYSKIHMIKYIKYLRKKRKIKWLDVGCGLGFLIKEAVDEGIDCYGIDISEYAVANAIVKDRVRLGSITEIPFKNGSFDVVSAFDVIEHVHPKDTEKAISEIYRVLKNDGLLILTTPHPCGLTDNWVYDLTHINVRPPRFWKRLLENYGFKVKLAYIPTFLKYYIYQKFSISIPLPDWLAFKLEEPMRYLIGKLYNKKERLYILAEKI